VIGVQPVSLRQDLNNSRIVVQYTGVGCIAEMVGLCGGVAGLGRHDRFTRGSLTRVRCADRS
jgi:hypothetical protein